MTGERLNDLAVISIEGKIAQEINIESQIDEFVAKKARRIKF